MEETYTYLCLLGNTVKLCSLHTTDLWKRICLKFLSSNGFSFEYASDVRNAL